MRRIIHFSFAFLFFALFLLLDFAIGDAQVSVPVPPTSVPSAINTDRYMQSQRLGITFINGANYRNSDQRYRNALALGAGWTRWPLYWDDVEFSPGQFNWEAYDQLVINDIRHGLLINAILLDRPGFYADGLSIAGINEPIFADGTDAPAAGKELNPNNPWALFVYAAVQRYKPGGVLAREQGWINGEGVTIWEIWNEPDLPQFWQGGINNYARLLKVAYLSAHMADPTVTVMYGGLLYNTPNNWLALVLAIFENDPLRGQNNWYMDAVALHSYSYPWRTGWLTLFVRETLKAYGLGDKPIFVNETGISIWDDYPGPVWTGAVPDQRLKLGTAEQQAWFFIQSTAYAYVEGASVVFFHQLYDDCGDQPAGTDFPPHDGELCVNGTRCFGDGFGLYRNTRDATCYSQHPNPGSPRPAAAAFRLMADVFGREHFVAGKETRIDGITDITFARPRTNERIHVIWNRRFEPNAALVTAEGSSATLLRMNHSQSIQPTDGVYRIDLRAAIPDSFPELEAQDISAIGGEPVILIEVVDGDLNLPAIVKGGGGLGGVVNSGAVPIAPTLAPFDEILPTPVPEVAAPQRPTSSPDHDTTAPVTSMSPLPPTSPPTFTVQWAARDDGQISHYIVWVQVNSGEWSPWVETQRTEGIYTGIPGNTYRFAVWAVDLAGNWSANTELTPQAETIVQ